VSFKIKDTFQSTRDRSRTAWNSISCVYRKKAIIFLPNRSNRFELLLVYVGYMCIYPVGCRDLHVDKDQYTRRSELCWSMLSTLLVWMSRCRCASIKISLVNEVQCGTGTEWRDLIGQQLGASGWMLLVLLSAFSCWRT